MTKCIAAKVDQFLSYVINIKADSRLATFAEMEDENVLR